MAGGRVYKGNAFISKPSEIIFKDFEIGKTCKQKFVLTNTSYTFNSFKLLDLSNEFIDFFDIVYTKLGRMSAGVSVTVNITFRPRTNIDIDTGTTTFFQSARYLVF